MNDSSSKGREIKLPGPDHPITISPANGKFRVTVSGTIVAESQGVLLTERYTYCLYKGDCSYYSIPIGGSQSENAVWTYERPHEAVASIREYLAFYPSRVDAIEVVS